MTGKGPLITLNNGVEMPAFGLGVYQSPPEQTVSAVEDAIAEGYRLIDTAAAYLNEREVGEGIVRSGIDRSEMFLTTKLWVQNASYDGARQAFERSLQRLGVEYLDLYLIHQPYGDVFGAWRAMEELYREGRVRAIGVSNFQPDRLMDIMVHNEVIPAVNQIEAHPFNQQLETQRFLEAHTVQMEGWAPFAEGKHDIFQNEVLRSIAEKHHKTVAQVILRWFIQRNVVVIPKSVRKERIAENFDVFDFQLSPEDMEAVAILDRKESSFFDHRNPDMVKQFGEAILDI